MSDFVTTITPPASPSRVERFQVDGHRFEAALFDAPGREPTWQIRLAGDDHGPRTVVVATHLDVALADLEADAERQRQQAQVHLDLADQADRQRSLIAALADQVADNTTPEPEPVDQPVQHVVAKPPPPGE